MEPEPAVEVAAERTVLPPAQNEVVPVTVAVGFALTDTTVIADVVEQPFEW
jgi:succinylarginine dihydrolase